MTITTARKVLMCKLFEIDNDHHRDREKLHWLADEALVDYLRNTGAGEAANFFTELPKWYA
jgi:hypothetical protein